MNPWLKEGAELAAIVAGVLLSTSWLSRYRPSWHASFGRHRLRLLVVCAAAVLLLQILEEVLGRESDVVDRAVLLAIHAHLPASLRAMFGALTLSASAKVIMPVLAVAAAILLMLRRRRDAIQLVVTAVTSSAVVYIAKTLVGRTRPTLWDTQWYWGSSFPSGHTLTATALATCIGLLAARANLRRRRLIAAALAAWSVGVGLSRLVLGVHWLTDVVAAACAGLLVGIGVDAVIQRHYRRSKLEAHGDGQGPEHHGQAEVTSPSRRAQ